MTRDPLIAGVEYEIPERSGEVLIAPPLDRVSALLAASREERWGDAAILGTPLVEFRRRVRVRALQLAAGGSAGAAPSPERPLLLMGHQPILFHPGIWVKYFLLTRLSAAHHATGLHLIVDTDASGAITAEAPARLERLVRVSETLLDLPGDLPLETAPPPALSEWDGFVERVRGRLATLPAAGLAEHLDAWAAGAAEARRTARSLGTFLAALRRAYEGRAGVPGYLELPVSALADTPEFRAFALQLLGAPDELRRVYNARLEEYRRAHRLRSAANPFPDLARNRGRVEAPFWVIRGGRRAELFVSRDGARLVLAGGAEPLAAVPVDAAGVEALAGAGVTLRPKAMALTMFARLCLGDLFIHGVGGGRYDRVTDAITADLFGCRPAPYLVATATLTLPLAPQTTPAGERRALERRLMDLRHNPDRHLASPTEEQRRLVDEKWALIRAVETMRRGPDRRAATRRIREVNARLAEGLADEIARDEARLAGLGEGDPEDVAGYRGYPFFLFDPAEVGGLVGASGCPA